MDENSKNSPSEISLTSSIGEKNILQVEDKISFVLRRGVIWAGGLIGLGWLWSFSKNGSQLESFQVYDSMSLYDSLQWAVFFQDRGKLLAYMGLGVLILLPIVRVAMTFYLFTKSNEKILAVIALVVLVGLAWSVSLGMEL